MYRILVPILGHDVTRIIGQYNLPVVDVDLLTHYLCMFFPLRDNSNDHMYQVDNVIYHTLSSLILANLRLIRIQHATITRIKQKGYEVHHNHGVPRWVYLSDDELEWAGRMVEDNLE